MSLDPESIMKTMSNINNQLGHMNKLLVNLHKTLDRNARAATKVVAAHNKQHGIMIGVVADLDLMGGAFGRMKRFLANLLLPIDDAKNIFEKFIRAFSTWGGILNATLRPIQANIKARTEEKKIRIKKANEDRNLLKLDQTRMKIAMGLNKPEALQRALRGKWQEDPNFPGSPRVIPFQPPTPFAGEKEPPEGKEKEPKAQRDFRKGFQKLAKPAKFFNKEVMTPLRQIMSGGIGLGFQTTIIMGLMQAFSNMFTVFQPVIDVVGILVERIGLGFMPIIEVLLEALTSPKMLDFIDQLSIALGEIMLAISPLIPIFIDLILIALTPLKLVLQLIAAIMTPLMPLFQIFNDLLDPLAVDFEILSTAISFIGTVIGIFIKWSLLPLATAIYGIGIVIAGLIDFFSLGAAGAVTGWNKLMLPILHTLSGVEDMIGLLGGGGRAGPVGGGSSGTGKYDSRTITGIGAGRYIDSYQYGTDYVPRTGPYLLHEGEEVRRAGEASKIIINIDGGVWVQDLDELAGMIGRKLRLIRG